MYNPGGLWEVAYNLTVRRQAWCLNDCSGHGSCSDDGLCDCQVRLETPHSCCLEVLSVHYLA